MSEYRTLKNLLASVMSVEVGLSEEREEAVLMASLQKTEYRNRLREELETAFADSSLSWINLLDNERYCVFAADSDEEAKEYIKEHLWDRIVSMDS
ncbi:hypothetical protein [Andreprevotia sp. IGB-42]|uniref:hypothetical protein n=1 Tax=Andreprevotia sp. IGB-42 TaxID=2497473 RepID=UPI0013597BCF|nr:hypothetical protein [Andreprevotia sp. IGB-42]